MRPLRSFLLLLIFLACFTGLHYIIHADQLFPSINEFVPSDFLSKILSASKDTNRVPKEPADTFEIASAEVITVSDSVPVVPAKLPVYPLQRFLDSLRLSRGQVRIIYYGDSQIEGDRITSFLRQTLRKGRSGTGPGLFLPLMPVMYTRSVWVRSSSNWRRYNYLSYKAGDISHRNLGPFMAICRYLKEGEISSYPEKAFIRIR